MLLVISFMIISFELGILTPIKQKHHSIYKISSYFRPILADIEVNEEEIKIGSNTQKWQYVASKNGKKYYFIWCSGVSRIKKENRVFFEKKEDAEKQGLEPSKTCSGL